jgi:uncharacterized phage protein (TIGR01671 family)
MRTIKFRVWDIDKNKMFNDCFELTKFGFIKCNQLDNSSENLVWLQFTGIEDANEKEVYEGDIHLSEVEDDGKIIKGYLPIVFDNGAFWLDQSFKKDGSYLTLLCEHDEPLNIVGNIYENPELLKIR